MCFSATASFTTAIVTSAIGIASINKASTKKELPFAMIPLFFGIQQFAEGLVWLSIQYNNLLLNSVASHVFVFFAYIFWPVFVPFAVLLLEKSGWRKNLIILLQGIGISLAAFFIISPKHFDVIGSVVNKCIVYTTQIYNVNNSLNPILIIYFAVTCFCLMISSHRIIKWLGFWVSLFLIVTFLFYNFALISVWCFFAAILSFMVYFYFNKKNHPRP